MRTTLLSILTASAALLLSPLAATQAASADQAPATSPVSLDARAAAAAAGSGIGTQSSWFSGTLSPGASQSWLWNNASSTRSYKAGLSPVGATTSASCRVEVTKSSYAQTNSGELEFRFTIKNVGTISCGANILLSSTTNSAVGATGGLNPGASKSYTWNNAVAGQSHLVGLVPSGATSTADCQFQVTRGYYARQSTGEREFRYTIQKRRLGDVPDGHPDGLHREQHVLQHPHARGGLVLHELVEQRQPADPGVRARSPAVGERLPAGDHSDVLLAAAELRSRGARVLPHRQERRSRELLRHRPAVLAGGVGTCSASR